MDSAGEVLERIREALQVDARRAVRRPGGFTWWAGRLAHHVDVGPPFVSGGVQFLPVTSRVPMLRPTADDAAVEAVIGRANLFSNSFSYIYDREQGEVFLLQRGAVPEPKPALRSRWLAMQFALQLHHAVTQCNWLCKNVGGEVAARRPPGRRALREAPELLRTVDARVFLAGRPAARCVGDFEFEAVRDVADHYGASATVGASGVMIEVPFGSDTATLVVTDRDRHPRVGAGLALWAHLPDTDSLVGAARLANWLNLRVARVRLREVQHGSWCVRRRSGDSNDAGWAVTYCRFVPTAFYSPGLALEAAVDLIQKVKRVERLLNPWLGAAAPDIAVNGWRWSREDAGRSHA